MYLHTPAAMAAPTPAADATAAVITVLLPGSDTSVSTDDVAVHNVRR